MDTSKLPIKLILVKFSLSKGKLFVKSKPNPINPNVSLAPDISVKLPGVEANIKLRENPDIKIDTHSGTLQ